MMTNEIRKLIETIEKIEEAKWDYKKTDKGRGAGTDSPMYDGGAKNRKSRKAFRKAQKAKAHAERMSGQQVEEEHIEIIGENEYDDIEDVINQLSDIKEQISGLVYDASSLVQGTNEEDSAKAYWIGHILGALDNESEYMGGSMTTMQDTIDALGEGENFEDDDEWPETDGNPYGDDRHNERGI